jgi:quinol-cytochrome oxidoreductase complex cytochrome b subunit
VSVKWLAESVIFAAVIMALWMGGQIAVGMYQTYYYVPDIVQAYESVEYLERSVSFGSISSLGRVTLPLFFGLMVLYMLVKLGYKKLRGRP